MLLVLGLAISFEGISPGLHSHHGGAAEQAETLRCSQLQSPKKKNKQIQKDMNKDMNKQTLCKIIK